jgi:uncharacterized protein YggE
MMTKQFFINTLLCATLLSSVNAYEISMDKQFSKKIMPDLLCSKISISNENKEEVKVLKTLSKYGLYFEELSKKYPQEIKGGKYSVTPKYLYKTKGREFIGFSGYVTYNICFNAFDSQNNKTDKSLTQSLDNIIKGTYELKNDQKTHISVMSGGWQVAPETYTALEDELKLESIKWANAYAGEISKSVNKKCEVSAVNISQHSKPITYRSMQKVNALQEDFTSVPSPIKSESTIQLNVLYKFICQ